MPEIRKRSEKQKEFRGFLSTLEKKLVNKSITMGSPELPNDTGEEDLRTTHIVHHPPAANDDSDNESMTDPAPYEGYQPLAMDENQLEYGRITPDDDEGFNSVHTNGNDTEYIDVEVTHGDPNMPQIESVDAEVERELWNEPRPQELQIELDSNKTEQILSAMASFTLPNISVPSWAAGVPEERWKEELLQSIRQRKPSPDNAQVKVDEQMN